MLFLIILLIIIIIYLIKDNYVINIEGFNGQTGRFCYTCQNKTYNQCMSCFNCGWCEDDKGNGQCIGGDHRGPWNYERCAKWSNGDPYSYMLERKKRKCGINYVETQNSVLPNHTGSYTNPYLYMHLRNQCYGCTNYPVSSNSLTTL